VVPGPAGFVVTSAIGSNPAWAAFAGAAVLAVLALSRRRTTPAALVRSAALPFLAFVLALGIVVRVRPPGEQAEPRPGGAEADILPTAEGGSYR
jgi:Na+/H+ antiporter NhaD/arsenite permease-like protein